MRGIISRELAARLALAIPWITECLLDHGPHLIDTLIPGGKLETHLTHGYALHPKNTTLLLRLQGQRARQASSTAQDIRQEYLFAEISSTLTAIAQRHPLMLLLDDLHWIDHSSAALLGHLAMRVKQSPILIIGSYRPEDLAQLQSVDEHGRHIQHPLKEVLSESKRQFGHNHIDLDHYAPGGELEFVNALLDVSVNDFTEAFRVQLASLTEGHPLFLVELLRDLREQGDIIQAGDGRWKDNQALSWENIPARVEGVIEKRIGRLPDELLGLLITGCVQGETFLAEVIAQVQEIDPRQVISQLSKDLDRQHRLIHESGLKLTGTDRLSQYRFRHNLFQKYLYGRLGAAERAYLHEAVGNVLEALYSGSECAEELPAAQLARHFQEARLHRKASRYLLLAGQQAARVLAFEEAAVYFERGITEIENLEHTPENSHLEYDLILELARSLWHCGRLPESLIAFQKSIDIARDLNDPDALAGAVLAHEEPRWRLNLDSQVAQKYMREALAALGEQQSGLRVRLLVGLARSLLAGGEQEELRTTVEQAVHVARHIDDPLALCDALRIKAQIDRRPETTTTRLAAIQELVATAEAIGDQERLADGLDLYIYDLLELGQIDQVDEKIAAQRQVAHEMKQPFQMHVAAVFQTMRAIMRGDFEKAERQAKEAADFSQQIGLADLDGIYGIHMFTIRREQGRLQEIAPIVKLVAANNPQATAWRPGLALIYSSLNLTDECRLIFETLASAGFAFVPQDSLFAATLAYLSEVCLYLGDAERAATLYELLLPYESRTVVVGGATACFGAAGRFLGMLSMVMSELETAERHYQQAIELNAHMGAWPWLAHSQFEYAAMLLNRGAAQHRQRANDLLQESLCTSSKLGMAYLVEKAVNLQARYELISS
jgi:tetratricopeptide (TPR) repeat protein